MAIIKPNQIEKIKEWNKNKIANIFVETGTFKGQTILNINSYFKELHSVDISEKAYNYAKERCEHLNNVHFYNEDSPNFLKKIIQINESIWFFLDAHYFNYPDKKFQYLISNKNEMPLIEELKTLKNRQFDDLIIIDDYKWIIREKNIKIKNILNAFEATKYTILNDRILLKKAIKHG